MEPAGASGPCLAPLCWVLRASGLHHPSYCPAGPGSFPGAVCDAALQGSKKPLDGCWRLSMQAAERAAARDGVLLESSQHISSQNASGTLLESAWLLCPYLFKYAFPQRFLTFLSRSPVPQSACSSLGTLGCCLGNASGPLGLSLEAWADASWEAGCRRTLSSQLHLSLTDVSPKA